MWRLSAFRALIFGLVTVGLTAAPCPASAYEVIQNGGFETDPLANWQTFSQGSSGGTGGWYSHASGNGTYSGFPTSPPPAGVLQAVADNSGRAAAILYQDVTIPPTLRATLSFTLWHGNGAPGNTWINGTNLSPANNNQRVRVDIIPTSLNLLTTTGALQLVYQTSSSTAQIVNPMTVTANVTALAGQTVRLRFALVATAGGLIAGIDQVKLDVSPFTLSPTPPSFTTGPLRWGDFDDDGRFEIAKVWQAGPGGSLIPGSIERWSTGLGNWQTATSLVGIVGSLGPADVDGDGDLDLTLSGYPNTSTLDVAQYYNDGFGGFSIGYYPVGASSGTVDWADCDRDGDLDALMTGVRGPYPETFIARNDGSGVLSYLPTSLPGSYHSNAIWNDLDNSGIADACAAYFGTHFAFGDGSGGFGPSIDLYDITNGQVASGDLDNDGIDELVVAGHRNSAPQSAAEVFRWDPGTGIWTPQPGTGLVGVYGVSLDLGDVDNDGWLDIVLAGYSTSVGYLTAVYHNNGNLTFTDMGANLPSSYSGSLELADFEGDGDLDIAYQGLDTFGAVNQLVLNSTPTGNAAPTPPGLLWSELGDYELLLRFGSFGNYDHTPPVTLTRNFRAGTSPGTCNLAPPMSNLATGRRLVPDPGQARHASLKRLVLSRIGHHHAVHWSVQNVDQAYLGSGWASEQTVVLGPAIASIADIPNDQGGHVRVTVQKSPFDDPDRTNYAAMGYNLWRQVPGSVAAAVAREGVAMAAAARGREASEPAGGAEMPAQAMTVMGAVRDLELVEWGGRLFVQSGGASTTSLGSPFPAGTWEIVASWFATQQASYQVASTTVSDSGVTGANEQSYIVTVHTTTPSVWFASLPASGHSVDNLAPASPVGLSAAYHTGSGNHLQWQAATENDFSSYRVYRGTSAGFVAGPGTLVASVPTPEWTDPTYDQANVFYKVSTADHAGNESAAVPPGSTTAVGGEGPRTPELQFALESPAPNPFTNTAQITFTMPRAGMVRLEIFDPSGRRLRTLVDGWQEAGAHSMRWDGEDDGGVAVGAGVYFCRIEAGEFRAVRRMARMR